MTSLKSRVIGYAVVMESWEQLEARLAACRVCEGKIPEPRPIFRLSPTARILIVGQAPGRKVHATGIPWNDPSGDRLRGWMGVDHDQFYDVSSIAILPMGMCYPGHGPGGDLPPRPECAPLWHPSVLERLPGIELILLVGVYAQRYYLGDRARPKVTETVAAWASYGPKFLPLVHPSPRNKRWFKVNPWFETEVVPALQKRVADLIR
jgi:uracil-DNA glycosylase